MTFPSGVSAQGSSSYCYFGGNRQKIFGSDGSIIMDPANTYYEQRVTIQKPGSGIMELHAGNPYTQFAAQVDGFAEAARSNTPHRTPGEMGLRDIRLIQAMYRSADAGGASVKV